MPGALTPAQLASFQENGFLVIPGALPPSTVESLLTETERLITAFDPSTHPLTAFTTELDRAHVGNHYFLSSAHNISYFLEPSSLSASGALTLPPSRSINKIGHNLHNLSPAFRRATLNAATRALTHSLGFRDPRVLQSMVICKQPGIGAAVPPHQDSAFLYTDPPSAVGVWYALEDATRGNGGLEFVAGSQRWAGLRRRFVRLGGEEGGGCGFEGLGVGEGDGVGEEGREWGEGELEWRWVEARSGDAVLIHGNVLHRSAPNTSDRSRVIYTFHVIEGENKYDEKNWLQPGPEGFSRLNDVEDE